MRIHLAVLTVGALLAVILAAGCGDSGSDGDAVVTKPNFLKEADAVCAKQRQQIQASVQSNDPVKASEEAAEGSVEALEAEMRAIEAIGVPSGDEQEIEAILKTVRKTLALAKADEADIMAASETLVRAEEQADKYGLKECFLQ